LSEVRKTKKECSNRKAVRNFGKERGHGLGGKKRGRRQERNEETREGVRCPEVNKEIRQELGGKKGMRKEERNEETRKGCGVPKGMRRLDRN
jgi:hypothetical protein